LPELYQDELENESKGESKGKAIPVTGRGGP
jgi:hypothetical protein